MSNDRKVRAFSYLRVLEIPTPRRTCYDAARFKVKVAAHAEDGRVDLRRDSGEL